MGTCSSVDNDQATNIENPSNRRLSYSSAVRPSDSRRVSQASVAYTQSNRRVSQSGSGDIQSTYATMPRRSSVSFPKPLVCTNWENEDQLNAPIYVSEPQVDSMVAYEDIIVHNPQEIIVAVDDAYNTSNIMTAPTDVPLRHPIAQIQPAFEAKIEGPSNAVQMESVIVDSSALPWSGYQVDDNGVVIQSSGETVVDDLNGNKYYDPMIGEMVYVLDQNASVDGLERITVKEINTRPSVLHNDVVAYVEEHL